MKIAINDEFRYTFTVGGEVYAGFINVFKDRNPLHTDSYFAKSKGFKGEVMHGNILNGFISYFVGELLPSKEVMILSQSINFRKPVYLNDSLEFIASVSTQSEAVSLHELKFRFENMDGKIVASGKIQIKELK